MKFARRLLITASLFVLCAGVAAALPVPIALSLDNVTIAGGTLPTSQTYVPSFPIAGGTVGNIDFGTGNGTLFLPDYSIFIDVNLDGDDVRLDITGWKQEITSIDGSGNLTSIGSGATACTVLGGIGGFVCPTVPPNVAGWPPADGTTLLSSAVIDTGLETITITDNSNAAAGTVTQFFSYSVVPEPGTALLLGGALAGLGVMTRRRRA